MKILFVLPEYYPHSGGGISTYYLHYLKALKSEVNEICVLVGSGYTQSDEIFDVDGIRVEYLKPEIFNSYLPKFSKFDLTPEYRNNMAAAWAMFEQSKQGAGFDIIECADFGLGFVPWLINKHKPVIVRLHGSTGQIDLFETKINGGLSADLHRQTELILLNYADKLISHSEANKIYWESLFQKKEVALIYPTFEGNQTMVPFNKRENYGIVCGRVQDWKGPDILCQAVALLKDDRSVIKWYGRDTAFNGKISKINQLKQDYPKVWGTQIKHEQQLPNAEILTIQTSAKFAIIPSTWDMFNFTGLEYLSAGTALICSDSAGVSELIENGVNGFKYANNNPAELANSIEELLKLNEVEYAKLVENGKKTIAEQLNASKIIDGNILVYTNILNSFVQIESNEFINELFKPSQIHYPFTSVLDNISLKKLNKYISRRFLKKLISS